MSNVFHSLTQPETVVCNNSGSRFVLAFYFFVLIYSAVVVSGSALAAPYVNPKDCGGNGQETCHISAAKNLGKIKPHGAFWDPRNGGEWWSCEGWGRTLAAVTASNACSKGIFGKTKRAKKISSDKEMMASGAFKDIGRGEWWRCPAGFTRNVNPVHKGEACSATMGKACDSGLIDLPKKGGGYSCFKKNACGKEGQRPCLIVERVPPCDKGLEEDSLKGLCRIGMFGDISKLDTKFDAFFKNTWEGRALNHQIALSLDVPLADASMIGSHNTYNSKSYNYIDPNQYLTIKDQLYAGAQFIELDMVDKGNKIGMCHKNCAAGDKLLTDGLDEVKNFLEDSKYKNRVFILYLEDHTKMESKAYTAVQDKIGKYVYNSNGCDRDIPSDLTPKKILDAGKRVVIWFDGGCTGVTKFTNMVFNGLGNIKRGWEDETSASAFAGKGSKYSPAEVIKVLENGENILAHDFLYINDEYKAHVWSWNANEPNNHGNGENCATQSPISRSGGRAHVWNDVPCSVNDLAFACQNVKGGWKITKNSGRWAQGEAECKALAGDYFFSVPASAKDNLALTKVKPSGWTVWLNYTDQAKEGKWIARHRWNSASYTLNWNAKEPNNHAGNEHCASQSAALLSEGKAHAHGWNDIPCSVNDLAFACQNAKGGWQVTKNSGRWAQGEAACKALAGSYFFSVPVSIEDNWALTKVKPSGWTVWLNLTDQAQEGKWVAQHLGGVQINKR